jgi:O-antigen ligase
MVLLLPVVIFLLIVPNLSEPLELPRSIALLVFTLGYAAIYPRSLKLQNKILILPLLIPILYIFSAILNDQNFLNAFFGEYKRNFGILTYTAVAILFIIISNSKNIDTFKLFKFSLMPIVVLIILYSYIQIFNLDFLIWGEPDRVVLTLGNSNYAASYIAILLPTFLYGITKFKDNLVRVFLALGFVAMVYSGVQTKSFQFFVVSFISILSYFIIYYYSSINKISRVFKILLANFGFLVIFFTLDKFRNTFIEFTSADDRLAQQRAGLAMFKENFLFGVGADNLQKYMPLYMQPDDIRREGIDIVADKTHNAVVDHFANGGVFVGTVYLFFLLMIFYFIRALLKNGPNRNLDLALPVSIFIGYFAQLFINTDSIANLPIPYICMGLISSFYFRAKLSDVKIIKGSSGNNLRRLIALILMFIFLPLSIRFLSVDVEVKNILENKYNSGEKIISVLNSWPYPRPTELILVKYISNLENCPMVDKISARLLEVNSLSGQAWFAKSICADAAKDQKSAYRFVLNALEFHPVNARYLYAKYQLEKFLGLEYDARTTLSKLKSLGISVEVE